MGKQNNLQLLKLSSLSLLIGMAGCTNSTLCHLQWYPVPKEEANIWTPKDTLTISVPTKIQDVQEATSCNWQLEATGNASFAYTHIGVKVGLATEDTVYWQEVQLQADSAILANKRQETFGRTLWKQNGNLLQKEIGSHLKDSLRRIIVLPLEDTQHINDIGLCVQRLSARK